jgi:type IV secretion system protein VirB9
MKQMIFPVLTILALGATPVFSQSASLQRPVFPQPGSSINTLLPITVAVGRQITLKFEAGETIENVAVGDSSNWEIATSDMRQHLFIKPLKQKLSTNMTVVTNNNTYSFLLHSESPKYQSSTYVIELGSLSPEPKATEESDTLPAASSNYNLKGTKQLFPSELRDDGEHTYLDWPSDYSMPAVYAIDETGEEVLVDGYMRGRYYTIDRVYNLLVFRIDKLKAEAQRIPKVRE